MTPRVADIPTSQVIARRIAGFLRFMRGQIVATDMLIEYVYGDRPNGPPKYPVQLISMTIRSLRARGYPVGGVTRSFVWDEERTFRQRRGLGRLDVSLRRDDPHQPA
jgi:hypothetical protein